MRLRSTEGAGLALLRVSLSLQIPISDLHYFEIVLYRLLCRFYDEVAVHPPLDNGFKPDFGMLYDDGSKIYVEAVLASERNGLTPSGQT